jgi:hypothetical protein
MIRWGVGEEKRCDGWRTEKITYTQQFNINQTRIRMQFIIAWRRCSAKLDKRIFKAKRGGIAITRRWILTKGRGKKK